MVFLISGAPHTGKTALAQRLLEKYGFPYISTELLKMKRILGSGILLPSDSDNHAMTDYLWPAVMEIVRTVLEERQNLIIEGPCIPFDWEKYFRADEVCQIKYICLVLGENYIRQHYHTLQNPAGAGEPPVDGGGCSLEDLILENRQILDLCRQNGAEYLLVDGDSFPVWPPECS